MEDNILKDNPTMIDAETSLEGDTKDEKLYPSYISAILYAEKISGLEYKITATAVTQEILIATFSMSFNYSDGSHTSVIQGVNQEPLVHGNRSFSSVVTTRHRFPSAGTYTISKRSASIAVCDVINPDQAEPAQGVNCSNLEVRVTN